MISGFYLVSLY